MRKIIDLLGGRKTIISIGCLVAASTIDIVTERGLSTNLMSLMMAVIAMYNTANVLNKKVVGGPQNESTEEQQSSNNDAMAAELLKVKENQQLLEQYAAGLLSTVENLQNQVTATNKRVAAVLDLTKQQ